MSAKDLELDRVREFVTRMALDTYSDRESQRCIPTFVTVVGGMLNEIYKRGGLHLNGDAGFSDVTQLIGHLNILWIAIALGKRMDAMQLAGNIRGIGYSYHLPDNVIADWQVALRNCAEKQTASGNLVAYFDRIIEPVAQIFGTDFFSRSQNWLNLLRDINDGYNNMMNNSKWIAELDAALDRAST